MSVREDLEALGTASAGVDHLVYGDLGTGMVLYANSEIPKGQEDHDALVKRGQSVFAKGLGGLEKAAGCADADVQVCIVDDRGTYLFVRSAPAQDEGLCLSVSPATDIVDLGDRAAAVLAGFGAHEDG